MICRAHNMSSCHLVDFTAHEMTSLMWIRSGTFLSDGLIIAEMLIIQTCPARRFETEHSPLFFFFFYDLGFFGGLFLQVHLRGRL